MSKADDLVNEAEKTKAGVPVDINKLALELADHENILLISAMNKIGVAIEKWRKNRPLTVGMKVVKASIEETGKPKSKDLQFTDRD
jgi:hypothetical protein